MKFKKMIQRFLLIFAKPTILFESIPDFSDNTMPVYQELVRRGYKKKYYLLWIDKNEHVVELDKNEKICRNVSKRRFSICNKLRFYSSNDKVSVMILCNRFYSRKCVKKILYLSHGSPLKEVHDYYNLPHNIDYCFAASKHVVPMIAYSLQFPVDKTVGLGYPRNDDLNCKTPFEFEGTFGKFNKYIIWYPTFRQHKGGGDDCASSLTLPIIHNENDAKIINEKAKICSVLIIVKPHFAQDTKYIRNLNLSNICFIDDSFFQKNGIKPYEFLSNSDAMISDYSSVYYDYLLCEKPIGLIWEDLEEYKTKPGLIDNYEYYCKGGEKIYNVSDFCEFIENVAQGIDKLKEERKEICNLMNYSRDGKNTKRVTDFIVEKAKL